MPDQETGLYYLQSRYYNPTWGRFINADNYPSTGQGLIGNNMFAYCGNNPVVRRDSTGTTYAFMGEYLAEVDPDENFDEGGPGGGGWGLGVSSSYYTQQNVRVYDSWWRNSCYNPNMTWSNRADNVVTVPQHAWDTLDYIKNHNGSHPKGYKGGKPFSNDGRNGGTRLPDNYKPFYEYDVHPKVAGQGRGMERIVIGSGAAWYTCDHYFTFTQME